MKIAEARVFHLLQPEAYGAPTDGGESAGVQNVCLLWLRTDDGLEGWADIETQPSVAQAVMEAPDQECFRGIRHIILGENPLEVDRLWQKMFKETVYYGKDGVVMQVMSGVINACYDIMGKAFGQPLCILLGAKNRTRVKAYASTLFRQTPEQMARAVKHYQALGFNAIKFGWGVFRDDPGRDVELVAAARAAAGPEMDIMVDAGWMKPQITIRNTLDLIKRIEKYRITWFEDCLRPKNYEGYTLLCRESPIPIAAGEQESGVWGFDRLIDTGISFVQPDLSRCGGINIAKQVAQKAQRKQIQVVPHAWLTDLLTAASLHFCAWLEHAEYLEFNVSQGPLARELFANPLRLKDGYLSVPDGPGFGVTPDMDKVLAYEVKESLSLEAL